MAATTLVREALRRVSDQLGDLDPQFTRHSQAALVQALSDAQRVIAKFLPRSCARVDGFKLEAGSRQSIETVPANRLLHFDGSTPVARCGNRLVAPPIRNLGDDGATPGRTIRVTERVVLDMSNPSWHTATGTEVREVVYDPQLPKIFYVHPGPRAGVDVWIELPWLPDPIAIPEAGDYSYGGASTVKLSIDDANLDDAVNYVIARRLLVDSEEGSAAAAAAYVQMFTSSINSQAVASGLPDPKLRLLPVPRAAA